MAAVHRTRSPWSTPVKLGIFSIILVGIWFFFSFMLMLLVMITHDRWWALVPQMGYATALILTGLSMVVGAVSGAAQAFVKAVNE